MPCTLYDPCRGRGGHVGPKPGQAGAWKGGRFQLFPRKGAGAGAPVSPPSTPVLTCDLAASPIRRSESVKAT